MKPQTRSNFGRAPGAPAVISPEMLSAQVRREGGGRYRLVDVPLPRDAPTCGILIRGARGSDKSLAIHDLMCQVFAAQKKSVIYDPTGEFYRTHFRPGIDLFFNPALEGSVPWSIFNDLRYSYEVDALANAFLPPPANSDVGEWLSRNNARALFSETLIRLKKCGAIDTRQIAQVISSLSQEEAACLIAMSLSLGTSGDAGLSQTECEAAVSLVARHLDGFQAVQSGGWSLREFLEQPGTARLFILATEDTRVAFAPLHRLLLTVAFGAIANEHEVVHEDKYWFFFDECQTLGDIRLDERVADLRKYGVAIVAGLQSDSEPAAWLSEDRAVPFASTFGTRLELLAREREAGQRTHLPPGMWGAVKRLMAWGLPKWRDGTPDEARAPKGCTGRLEFPGAYAACEVHYSSWLDEARGGNGRTDRFPPIQPLPTPAPPLYRSCADGHQASKPTAG